jgi:cell pole-organizing protein PopZ
MAKPGSAQEQTVEEILASIRQVINGDQPRSAPGDTKPGGGITPAPRRPADAVAPPRANGTVTAIYGGKIAPGEVEAPDDAPAGDESPANDRSGDAAAARLPSAARPAPGAGRAPMNDVIELAIEEALGGLNPDETRPESAVSATAETHPPLRATIKPPRVEPPPSREPSRFEPYSTIREAPRPVQPAPRPLPQPASRSLLSPRANAAVTASFDDLARVLASRGANQIDQTVEDLLRPMLKSWLEDNLPSLVERLVREEIERVSRGGR